MVPLNVQHHVDMSLAWLYGPLSTHLKRQPVERIVGTWGNHDWVGQLQPGCKYTMPFECLVDERVDVTLSDGRSLSIYGSPWQPEFNCWAFNLPEDELAKKWARIPDGIDVLLLHGPPLGILDDTGAHIIGGNGRHLVGSSSLYSRLGVMKQPPRVVVFGHVHHSHGARQVQGIRFFNAAICTEQYKPTNPVTVFEL